MIVPERTPSSLDGAPKKFIHRVMKINASTKSLVERLCDFQDLRDFCAEFHWLRVCSRQSHPQSREPCPPVYHSRTVQRNPLFITLHVGSICGLGPDVVGIHSITLVASLSGCSMLIHSPQRSRKLMRHAGTIALLSLLFHPLGNVSFFSLP